MTQQTFDVAIIGGGHNGLSAAGYLSRAGLSVVVLEKNAVVGGAAVTEEFAPGFKNSVASYTVSLLNPKVIADLELHRFGLQIIERPAANFWPIDDQRSLLVPYDEAGRKAAYAAISERDANRLDAYDNELKQAVAVLRDLITRTPPNAGGGILELIRAGAVGRRVLKLTTAQQRLLLELFTSSAADYLASRFDSEIVQATFAFDGIVGSYAAPSTPGTAYVLLHHCFGEVNGKVGHWGQARGGMGAITQAMAASAEAHGATIRTSSPAARVLIERDRATGVVLKDGSVVKARAVAANVGPKLLFRDLIDAGDVAPEVRAPFLGFKTGSGSFRMNVALSELPDFTARPGKAAGLHHRSGIVIGPTMRYLEQAYLDARNYGWSREPVVELMISSANDPTLAPPGQHVASLFVQHVAPHLPEGRSWTNPSEKEAFADLCIETVSRHAPNFKNSVIARQVLSPLDLENRFGLVDGDIFHGQLGLGQLFSARPVLGYGNYRMPIRGLYLCGSGAHPGGGVTGVPGMNAAREIVKDARRRLNARAD